MHYRRSRVARLLIYTFCLSIVLSLLAACEGAGTGPTSTGRAAQNPTAPSISCSAHSSVPVTLTMYYGSEKEQWIDDVIGDFNTRHVAACDGPITVRAVAMGSGDSMQRIIAGERPDIWSPAGSIWLRLLNDQWQQKHASTIVSSGATDTPPLLNSPVVIAMWKPQAQALGWPNKQLGWSDIARLSTDPRGWSAYGHPEWGDFKFGHTHPDYSNSGLDAVIAEHYAAVNKQRGLSIDDVQSKQTQDFVANVESSVIHYGESTLFFAQQMFRNGPNYLSAAVMYENVVVEANDGKTYPGLKYPVVAIYPREGTFYSDHPFAVLQGNWVTPAKKAAAQALRNFLLAPEQQRKALRYGFRPAELSIPVATPIDSGHGVDPAQPRTTLPIPSADVVKAIKTSWDQQRRKVNVMLILDHSGSMNDSIGGASKIDAAKQGLIEFVDLLGDSDGLGLTIFSTDAQVLTPVTDLGSKRQNVLNMINAITAQGSTRLYNTIAEQVQALKGLPSKQRIKSVVVLTDGKDTVNQMNVNQLVGQIAPASDDVNAGENVKVFTIAYGKSGDVDEAGLKKIADATGGQEYPGTPQNIRQVYQMISEFF